MSNHLGCFSSSFVILLIQCQLSSPSIFDIATWPNLLSSIHKQDSIQVPQSLYPVILLPGYMGSQLQVTLDRENTIKPMCTKKSDSPSTLWLSFMNHQPFSEECWLENAALHWDASSGKSFSDAGVNVTVRAFGTTDGIEFITPGPQANPQTMYFYNLIRALEVNGYSREKSIKGAPYDWRKGPYENEGFFLSLRRLIEETYESNNQQPVIILCHSMGCTLSYIFLKNQSTEWKNRYVRSWIVIGAPFGGTYRYLYLYFADDDPPLASMFRKIRLAERTFSSVPFLLPRPSVYQNDVLVQTSSKNYTALDYTLFFQALNMSPPLQQWNLVSSMELEELKPIGSMDVHCIGGIGQKTLTSAIIDGDLTRDSKWTPVYGDGDEYVITKSMRECKKLDPQNGKFSFKEFTLDHMQLIKEKTSLDYIMDIINSINGRKKKKQKS